jgi:hypothetical protein
MDDPNFIRELNRIDYAEGITAEWQAISNMPDPMPRIGFAISAFPPSAAKVSAVSNIDLAPSGKVSNSRSAALIHEMGRVFRIMTTGR